MNPSLRGIDDKLERAKAHIYDLEQRLRLFSQSKPYTVLVKTDVQHGKPCGRLVATRNHAVPDPDVTLVLLAGEALYQLRSALDHLVHQLVALNGNAAVLKESRSHQFPIFKSPQGYGSRACGMIYGVASDVGMFIEDAQPYKRTPHAPTKDPLWILQDLNNTDKHRLIPLSVTGIGEVQGRDSRGALFSLTSEDLVLEDNKVFWSFTTENGRYDDIRTELSCKVAFHQAMSLGTGITLSMSGILSHIHARVHQLIEGFRPRFQ